jgi:hypothetical protein
MVIANIWSMHRDENMFPQADAKEFQKVLEISRW